MDIKKLASIVEETPLTDESKNLIISLLPQAEDPATQQQILDIMSAEADENRQLAEEVNEMRVAMEMGDREIADIEERVSDKVLEQYEDLNDRLGEVSASTEESVETPVEGQIEQTPVPEQPVQEQPVQAQSIQEQPMQGQSVQVPQWDQPSYPTGGQQNSPQPAPFPGSQNQY